MSKVLFLSQPSIGHVNTLLSIATQMKADGHNVHFLVPGIQGIKTNIQILDTAIAIPERIKSKGIEFNLLPPALSSIWRGIFLPLKSGYDETLHAQTILVSGIEHYTRYIIKFIESDRPDILVTDFAFPATSLAADITKLPYVAIYHSGLPFRGDSIPPFGSGLPINPDYLVSATEQIQLEDRALNKLDRRINFARQVFGLDEIEPDMLRRPYSPWLNLITSATVMEAPRSNLSKTTFFIGTCFGMRSETQDFPFDMLQSDKFKIYVSLGTVFNNKPEIFRKIMRALNRPDYQVIISAGAAYETLQTEAIPQNTLIFKSVPQIGLLPKIDLFISHGGNNSTNEALASAKPIIVLPVGGEQTDNASRVVYLGVGKQIDIKKFSEEQLLATVEEIRRNPSFQKQASVIMNELKMTQGVVTASYCIDWVAQNRQPLQRKEGIPLTIAPVHLEKLLGN